jgi:ketosteroid isomerase-like protein
MAPPYSHIPPGLLATQAAFDDAFSHDRGSEMGRFFSRDARLMWPDVEDIVGREAIRAAFEELIANFTTISWNPERTFTRAFEDMAISIGKFTEDRAPRLGGSAVRVFGRLVEYWSLGSDGTWTMDIALTSRYAEDQSLGNSEAPKPASA